MNPKSDKAFLTRKNQLLKNSFNLLLSTAFSDLPESVCKLICKAKNINSALLVSKFQTTLTTSFIHPLVPKYWYIFINVTFNTLENSNPS